MSFKPLHDRIAVKPVTKEQQTAGGIIIPDTATEKPMEGIVIAVGGGTVDQNNNKVPLEVKEGDTILYGKWGGTEVKIDGQDLIIMKESDVLGIITK
ncbi:MAG: co-chaperone GroES [Rickettsiaceae bacterium]|nr:co-chaperone GroES [Rickettsiaceae bacterium]